MTMRLQTISYQLISLCIVLGYSAFSLAKDFNETEITHVHNPDWFSTSDFLDLSDEVSNIKASGKKGLMVMYTTEGCSYCTAFIKRSLGDKTIAANVQKNFISIGLEIFDDTEMVGPKGADISIKDFATREGVQFSPTLLFYDNQGNRTLRLAGYATPEKFKQVLTYLNDDHYKSQPLKAYLQSLKQKPKTSVYMTLKSDPLFEQPPYMLDRSRFPAEKPMVVLFETTNCVDCEEFHSKVLTSQKVRDTLKHFDVVRFDAKDNKTPVLTPAGKRTTPAAWYAETGMARLPALLFIDEKGKQVLDTDALVMENRMMNSMGLVLEKAYQKGWTYQRFARSKSMERMRKQQQPHTN